MSKRSSFCYGETSLKVGFVLMTKLLLLLIFKLFCVSKPEIFFSIKCYFKVKFI